MGNSKNKKVSKKRKASNTSKCNTTSDQKENVPKTPKTRNNKPDPDDGIAMSKQLLLKKNKLRTQRRSSSKPDRICPNGKPIPSLTELEKMFENSDDDDDDHTPETSSKKPPCASSTPEKGTPKSVSQNNLLSPTTINKITKRLLGSIQMQELPDPSEVLEATSLIREKSPPPPPVIPPKKRKKTEIPYIVGCKDRPKVIRKPNTNFCKGDDDYGVEASSEDPEEPQAAKRGKKSRIPNYSKSFFNAHTDEIVERLAAKDDAANLSDASSDSNKTIEYEPTLIQNLRPQSFSPLPSTSRDSETFKKNDELFNESLKTSQITKDTSMENDELIDKNLNEINITKEITTKEKDEQMTNVSTPKKREDGVSIYKKSSPIKNDDDVQIIDIPYDTIVIDDIYERTVRKKNNNSIIDSSVIEIIEPAELEVAKPKNKTEIPNDEDCMIVPNSGTHNNYNNYNLNEPIVIDDEYSTINTEFDSFTNEPIEIIDVDDIIAENNTILDKWKNSQEFNKITTHWNVTAVQATVKPSTTVQRTSTPSTTSTQRTTLQASVSPSTTLQASLTPGMTLQASVPPTNTLHASVTPGTTLQTSVPPSNTLQASITPGTTLQASVPPSNTLQASLTPGTTLQASVPPNNTLQASVTPGMTLQASVPPRNTLQASIATLQARVTPRTTLQANLAPNTADPTTARHSSGSNLTPRFRRILDDFFSEQFINLHSESRTSNIGNETAYILKAITSSLAFTPANKYIPGSPNTSQNTVNRESNLVELSKSSSNSRTAITNVPPAPPVLQRNIGDCPICLDPLSSSNGIASTICGHVFCLKCIQASVKTNGKKCPTCRKALKGAGYHQLYL